MSRVILAAAAIAVPFAAPTVADAKPPETSRGCSTKKCSKRVCARRTACQRRVNRKLRRERRAREWRYWTRQPIAACTWLNESGPPRRGHGPGLQQFARWRYTVPNSAGSGAYGKFQMMPGTYHASARYHDWSPLDQEIAAHRLYRSAGTGPWEGC